MNKKDKFHKAPTIRIGIIQSAETVTFKCHEDFQIVDVNNQVKFAGRASTGYVCDMSSPKPAKVTYQIRTGLYRDLELARERSDLLKEKGFEPKIRRVGLTIPFETVTLDNRDYWLVVGDFESRNEAEKQLSTLPDTDDSTVVENIETHASGEISIDGQKLGSRIRVIPSKPDAHIAVDKVPIGIEFHWQRTETLEYRGILEIGFNNSGELEAINELNIEDYLASVNSSEMTPDCPIALLEAQTIAARSTVLATMGKHHYNTSYHLCSDDHCQCYQGVLREQDISRKAVENTYGEFLMYGGDVCDARYSKICGGIIENYRNVWDERDIPYLVDGIDSEEKIEYPADTEDKAQRLIDSSPPVFCNTDIHELPPKLANLYSTENLFRWEVSYKREEIEQLIREKNNVDIGELQDIIPLSRGASGRIIYIKIVGSKRTITVGKELNIRRLFSKSHLYSSCFYVKKVLSGEGKVDRITLKGGGWGHGVGLCQVGATVMALKGYHYTEILKHYFKNIEIKKLYF
ncbi:MAG: SpoIID/LytB domain-containing protein [candidate division KSB1 bacterium]|jgi:SpoIID/LytB domain protein|nr:SpoIID/LytB domain-containing protein [candidate division KSB1 bacterium]